MAHVIRAYVALSLTAILWMTAVLFGGKIEQAMRPILVDAKVDGITRTADKACWSWDALKMRVAMITDIDAVIDHDGDLSFPEVRDRVTGRVWHSAGSKPPGPVHHDVCVELPSTIEPNVPVILHTTVRYKGATPLWQVQVALPDVIVPGIEP